jgi:uncharacterized protein YndB with AHSA1/START domain
METHDLVIERVLKAPRAQVWRAWSDPKNLAQWWCPKPWVTEVKAFDFRPGGGFHTFLSGPFPDGTKGESDNPGCFLEIAPMERIVTTSALGAGWRPIPSGMPITSVFSFADEGQDTRYRAVCMHLDAEGAAKHAEMGFEHGWGIMTSQLEAFAAALS